MKAPRQSGAGSDLAKKGKKKRQPRYFILSKHFSMKLGMVGRGEQGRGGKKYSHKKKVLKSGGDITSQMV